MAKTGTNAKGATKGATSNKPGEGEKGTTQTGNTNEGNPNTGEGPENSTQTPPTGGDTQNPPSNPPTPDSGNGGDTKAEKVKKSKEPSIDDLLKELKEKGKVQISSSRDQELSNAVKEQLKGSSVFFNYSGDTATAKLR